LGVAGVSVHPSKLNKTPPQLNITALPKSILGEKVSLKRWVSRPPLKVRTKPAQRAFHEKKVDLGMAAGALGCLSGPGTRR